MSDKPQEVGVDLAHGEDRTVYRQEDVLTPQEQNAVALAKLKMLARQITTNDHFEAILMQAQPALRKGVYDEIVPHLRFKAKAWTAMKFNRRNRRKRGKVE